MLDTPPPRTVPTPTALLWLLGILPMATTPAGAAVVVLANHSAAPVTVEVGSADGAFESRLIAAGDASPFFSGSPLTVAFGSGTARRVEGLAADSIYRLVTSRVGQHSGLQLRRVSLMGERVGPPNPASWRVGEGRGDAPVRVWLCVDEEEPTRERHWQARLAGRLKKASDIMQRYSGVRFEVVGYREWRSSNDIGTFERTLAEFEKTIRPPAGTLAIGFTSQYHVQRGRHRMGGTRGPLRQHILLREWSPRVGEAERVELLVHELGHYLGASHSPEPTSVMRPVLGDRPVRLRDEVVRFDPVNTLAVAMVGEEVRRLGIRDLGRVSTTRRKELQNLYTTLSALTPGEPAGAALLRRLAMVDAGRGLQAGKAQGVVSSADRSEGAAAAVVRAITRHAAANQKRSFDTRLSGDALTDELVRAGAAAASDPKGLLIGLGIGLDDSDALRSHPRTQAVANRVEADFDRRRRLNVLGKPTARSRADTLKHFFVSGALTAIVGEKEAALWGVAKELADATRPGGSGFSFADLAADRAGIRFATAVGTGNPPLSGLARNFRCQSYLPALEGLEEGLTMDDVVKRFGGQGDPRFEAEIEKIDQRIEALPAYSLMRIGLPWKEGAGPHAACRSTPSPSNRRLD